MNNFSCKVCNKYFKTNRSLIMHLNKNRNKGNHPSNTKLYYDQYYLKENENICRVCKVNKTKFINLFRGYSYTCSFKCKISDRISIDKMSNTKICKSEEEKTKTKNRFKNTLKQRYGVECIRHINGIEEKMKSTNLKKYGSEYLYGSDYFKEKTKLTCLEKYGTDSFMKTEESKQYFSNLYINKFKDDIIRKIEEYNFKVLEYISCTDKCSVQCHKDHIFEIVPNYFFDDRRSKKCPICFPRIYGKQQREVYDYILAKGFVNKNDILYNDRTLLKKYEIDILIPKLNISIEYNGIYWHKDRIELDNIKTTLLLEKGFKHMIILDRDWEKNNEDVKNKINDLFNITVERYISDKEKYIKNEID